MNPQQITTSASRADSDNRSFFCIYNETLAEFPGGMNALIAYMQCNANYPEAARQANITGKVFVTFELDTAGFVSDIRVLKGLGYGCDEEAIRLIRAMPGPWKPATRSGHVMAVQYNIPVFFPPELRGQSR